MCHGITVPVINKMLDWFKINQMKVNDDNFQYTCIVFCKNKTINNEYVSVGSNEIMSSSYVKFLGDLYFDQKLSYYYNVDE